MAPSQAKPRGRKPAKPKFVETLPPAPRIPQKRRTGATSLPPRPSEPIHSFSGESYVARGRNGKDFPSRSEHSSHQKSGS